MSEADLKPVRTAGVVLGIGMGGFFDGIVFHQILQLHNMLSNRFYPDTVAKADLNMFWDGIFHAFTWTMTAIGISLLWQAARKTNALWSKTLFIGSLLLGWGLFNLIEGIVDHHILELHHVVETAAGTDQLMWDIVFDLSGLLMIIIGLFMIKKVAASKSPLINEVLRTANAELR